MQMFLVGQGEQLNEKQIAQVWISLANKKGKEHGKGTKKTSKPEVIAIKDNARSKRIKTKTYSYIVENQDKFAKNSKTGSGCCQEPGFLKAIQKHRREQLRF